MAIGKPWGQFDLRTFFANQEDTKFQKISYLIPVQGRLDQQFTTIRNTGVPHPIHNLPENLNLAKDLAVFPSAIILQRSVGTKTASQTP
jgi:hypothetical protein